MLFHIKQASMGSGASKKRGVQGAASSSGATSTPPEAQPQQDKVVSSSRQPHWSILSWTHTLDRRIMDAKTSTTTSTTAAAFANCAPTRTESNYSIKYVAGESEAQDLLHGNSLPNFASPFACAAKTKDGDATATTTSPTTTNTSAAASSPSTSASSSPMHSSPDIILGDWQAFVNGVSVVSLGSSKAPAVAGCLATFLPAAIPILLDHEARPVVAAARYGTGRVVVFGHGGFFTDRRALLKQGQTRRFVANALDWAAAKSTECRTLAYMSGTRRVCKNLFGLLVARSTKLTNLERYDLVIVRDSDVTPDNMQQLLDFAKRGGGLVVAGCGYRWQAVNDMPLSRSPANAMLSHVGVLFTAGRAISHSLLHGVGVTVLHAVDVDLNLCDSSTALRTLYSLASGTLRLAPTIFAVVCDNIFRLISAAPLSRPLYLPPMPILSMGMKSDEDEGRGEQSVPATEEDAAAFPRGVPPTPEFPVQCSDQMSVARLLVGRLTLLTSSASSSSSATAVSTTATSSTGSAAAAAASATEKTLLVDTGIHGRHSTGIYLRPNESLDVTFLTDTTAATKAGTSAGVNASLLVGSCTDVLWRMAPASAAQDGGGGVSGIERSLAWRRHPEAFVSVPLSASSDAVTSVSSPHGGLVYVLVRAAATLLPRNRNNVSKIKADSDANAKACAASPAITTTAASVFKLRMRGGSLAPTFVQGAVGPSGDVAAFSSVCIAAASSGDITVLPYAELVGAHITLTLPTAALSEDNVAPPDEILNLWDGMAAAMLQLCPPALGFAPQRLSITADTQPRGDARHAGHPCVVPLSDVPALLNLQALRTSGHLELFTMLAETVLPPLWLPDTYRSSLVLLLVLYACETVLKLAPHRVHPRLANSRQAALDAFFGTTTTTAITSSSSSSSASSGDGRQGETAAAAHGQSFALVHMLLWLQRAFGWELIRTVLHEQSHVDVINTPVNESERIDSFLVTLARTVNVNLLNFYQLWNVRISVNAIPRISSLPSWLPGSTPEFNVPPHADDALAESHAKIVLGE